MDSLVLKCILSINDVKISCKVSLLLICCVYSEWAKSV